jgi:Putative MetA-pathway of phenol degradation
MHCVSGRIGQISRVTAIGAVLCVGAAEAQVPDAGTRVRGALVTDRPDFTEASSTVGRGTVQVESGYTFSRNRAAGVAGAHALPELLVRFGVLSDAVELRVGQSVTRSQVTSTGGQTVWVGGADDLYLGAKIAARPQLGWKPEVALVLQSTLPTGHRDVGAGRALPGVNLLYGWEILPDRFSLGGSTQVNAAAPINGARATEYAQSVTFGYEFNQRFGSYAESFVLETRAFGARRRAAYANGGFRFKVLPDLQLDLRAGVGLNHDADDLFFGVGLAVRR